MNRNTKPSSEVVVLVENTTYSPSLCAKHGFSLGLYHQGEWLLFDTGPDSTLQENAKKIGFPLEMVSHIILSHGHYDHTGGMEYLSHTTSLKHIWAHPLATRPKYRMDGSDIGMHLPAKLTHLYTPVETNIEILPGVWILLPAKISYQDDCHFDNLLVEENGEKKEDTFEDELSLVIDHGESISLFTGCAHRGITNIIENTWQLFNKPFQLVMGGFHLRHTSPEIRQAIISRLVFYPVSQYAVCHCTGLEAYHDMKSIMDKRITYASVSTHLSLLS